MVGLRRKDSLKNDCSVLVPCCYDMHVSLSGVASTFGTVTLLVAYLANGLKRVCTRHYSVWHEGNRCFLDTTACQHDLFDFA